MNVITIFLTKKLEILNSIEIQVLEHWGGRVCSYGVDFMRGDRIILVYEIDASEQVAS